MTAPAALDFLPCWPKYCLSLFKFYLHFSTHLRGWAVFFLVLPPSMTFPVPETPWHSLLQFSPVTCPPYLQASSHRSPDQLLASHRRGCVITNSTKERNTTTGDQWRCRASKCNQLMCGRIPQIISIVLPTLTTKRCLLISADKCLNLVKHEAKKSRKCAWMDNKSINNKKKKSTHLEQKRYPYTIRGSGIYWKACLFNKILQKQFFQMFDSKIKQM